MDTKIVELMRSGGGDMGMGGMNPIWAIVLLAFLRGGFGGFDGNGGGAAVAGVEAASAARFTGIEAQLASLQGQGQTAAINGKLDGISGQINTVGTAICSSTYEINNVLNGGFNSLNQAITNNGFMMQQGFCNLANEGYKNTTAIIEATNRNGAAILAEMKECQIRELQTRLCESQANLVACNAEKATATMISAGNANVIKHVEWLLANKTVTPAPALVSSSYN